MDVESIPKTATNSESIAPTSEERQDFTADYREVVSDRLAVAFGMSPALISALLASMNRWQRTKFLKATKNS